MRGAFNGSVSLVNTSTGEVQVYDVKYPSSTGIITASITKNTETTNFAELYLKGGSWQTFLYFKPLSDNVVLDVNFYRNSSSAARPEELIVFEETVLTTSDLRLVDKTM